MNVGNIKVEIFQTEMKTDEVVLEGIDNPYGNLEKLRKILSDDINSEEHN